MNISQIINHNHCSLKPKTLAGNCCTINFNSNPKAPLKNDTLELSQRKKRGLFFLAGASFALGVGLLIKQKLDISKLKQNIACIEHKEAKTIEEAMHFGAKNLGIIKYEGFKEGDLDVINWANEGLVLVNNASSGKAKMPVSVEYLKQIQSQANEAGVAAMSSKGKLLISKRSAMGLKEEIRRFLSYSPLEQEIKEKAISQLTYKKACQWAIEIVKNNEELYDKIELNGYINRTPFHDIAHEIGHLEHQNNIPKRLYNSLGKPEERPKRLHKHAFELLELFDKSINTVQSVSRYAQASPLEFVAEVYGAMCEGRKFDKGVLELYQKLGGVMI